MNPLHTIDDLNGLRVSDSPLLRVSPPPALPAVRTWGGGGGETSAAGDTQTSTQVGAQDQGVAVEGTGNAVNYSITTTDQGALAAGKELGQAAISANQAATRHGFDFAQALGAGAQELAEKVGLGAFDLTNRLTTTIAGTAEEVLSSNANVLDQALESNSNVLTQAVKLAETKLTDDQTGFRKTFLYVVGFVALGLIAAVALIARPRRA